jgi:hypothetical protein
MAAAKSLSVLKYTAELKAVWEGISKKLFLQAPNPITAKMAVMMFMLIFMI